MSRESQQILYVFDARLYFPLTEFLINILNIQKASYSVTNFEMYTYTLFEDIFNEIQIKILLTLDTHNFPF